MAGRLVVGVLRGRHPRRAARAACATGRLDRSPPHMTHEIPLERRTLHGHFSRDLPPVLTVESGDTIAFATLDSGWGLDAPPPPGPRRHFEPRDPELDSGHALVGPIEVRGARAGQA